MTHTPPRLIPPHEQKVNDSLDSLRLSELEWDNIEHLTFRQWASNTDYLESRLADFELSIITLFDDDYEEGTFAESLDPEELESMISELLT